MKDIETRARDALNEARGGDFWLACDTRKNTYAIEAMCRRIEAHDATKAEFEALKHEVREAVKWVRSNLGYVPAPLSRLILPEPVDPLVEAFDAIHGYQLKEGETWSQSVADRLRVELAKRGLTITEQQP